MLPSTQVREDLHHFVNICHIELCCCCRAAIIQFPGAQYSGRVTIDNAAEYCGRRLLVQLEDDAQKPS